MFNLTFLFFLYNSTHCIYQVAINHIIELKIIIKEPNEIDVFKEFSQRCYRKPLRKWFTSVFVVESGHIKLSTIDNKYQYKVNTNLSYTSLKRD